MSDAYLPTAEIAALKARAALTARVRSFFEQHDYWEVETPLLCRESVIDAHLDPFELILSANNATTSERFFLQTSPEFCMKRLLAAGADRIYQITRAFRKDEAGDRHNPEFSILEWYALDDDLVSQMSFVEALCRELLHPDGLRAKSFLRVTWADAFENVLGIQILELDAAELMEFCLQTIPDAVPSEHAGIDEGWDFWAQLLLCERIEPWLAEQHAVFLYNYPASQAALARLSPEDPRVAERFELYVGGLEICNGYRELLDASVLRERNALENAIRVRQGLSDLPETRHLLAAMEAGLPDCSGVALGLDRLIMLALKRDTIDQVISFPIDRV
ncbi:EF-P lysine aminoacylase EpmA [Rubinisphaera margarita]|uniref:EF-P lysine aminoacylase EpmA n=1 Tax=Rubinisphaera margarita TaxID=2909586 RepID=UPI001EE9A015|nr:EF-P lysine aminoacylase EpmA [Rubinisphaera margarita]MCG6156714.1 EF-P lysine aminoacylase GenX [Rubinisphaera margarita]